ncbi:conserved hypothetical protein [Rubrivivax sp. A210]|uniref:hypothetical protein n=1 Tax=Rubrivivax sp. A210 TaxID=2772301 RepID=UPI00191B0543|nr:hypothetical protein [Rubrivivax sp. A210]CAD5373080.1 conserved hypothetical protein [Rubrivivax sp. A210]
MNSLKNHVFNNAKHWQNNFAGIFLLSATIFAVVIAVNLHFISQATASLLWLLGIIGIASLGCWTWLAMHTGTKTAQRVLFKPR